MCACAERRSFQPNEQTSKIAASIGCLSLNVNAIEKLYRDCMQDIFSSDWRKTFKRVLAKGEVGSSTALERVFKDRLGERIMRDFGKEQSKGQVSEGVSG